MSYFRKQYKKKLGDDFKARRGIWLPAHRPTLLRRIVVRGDTGVLFVSNLIKRHDRSNPDLLELVSARLRYHVPSNGSVARTLMQGVSKNPSSKGAFYNEEVDMVTEHEKRAALVKEQSSIPVPDKSVGEQENRLANRPIKWYDGE